MKNKSYNKFSIKPDFLNIVSLEKKNFNINTKLKLNVYESFLIIVGEDKQLNFFWFYTSLTIEEKK